MKKLGGFSASGHSQAGRAAPHVSPGVLQLTRGVRGLWGSVPPDTDGREGDARASAPRGTAVVRGPLLLSAAKEPAEAILGEGPRCLSSHWGSARGRAGSALCPYISTFEGGTWP